MLTVDISKIDFNKGDGLVPAIVQDDLTGKVLMLAYMNREALEITLSTGKVTFFSRSKNRIWTKGETSGYFLLLRSIAIDCDQDTLLVKAQPVGPACHTGADTCFNETNTGSFLHELEQTILDRKLNPSEKSYTTTLFNKGINKIAQKVGEEAVELIIEAKDEHDDLFLNEAADLMYHFLVLLAQKNLDLKSVENVLRERHKK